MKSYVYMLVRSKPKVYSSPFYYFKTLIDNFYGAKVLTEGEEFHVFYKLERHGGE